VEEGARHGVAMSTAPPGMTNIKKASPQATAKKVSPWRSPPCKSSSGDLPFNCGGGVLSPISV
jgi:hypothetical protein